MNAQAQERDFSTLGGRLIEQGSQAEGMSAVVGRVQENMAQERGETQVGPSYFSSSEREAAMVRSNAGWSTIFTVKKATNTSTRKSTKAGG